MRWRFSPARPAVWALTQMNRAIALWRLGDLTQDAANYRKAIEGYDLALEVQTRAAMRADWATTQVNRAIVLQSLGELTEDVAIYRSAIAGYDRALEVFTCERMPAAWARTRAVGGHQARPQDGQHPAELLHGQERQVVGGRVVEAPALLHLPDPLDEWAAAGNDNDLARRIGEAV